MMFGAMLAVGAALGASALDGVMFGLARRIGSSPTVVRIAMEAAMAVAGAAIGGRIGVGTVVMEPRSVTSSRSGALDSNDSDSSR